MDKREIRECVRSEKEKLENELGSEKENDGVKEKVSYGMKGEEVTERVSKWMKA